MLSDGEEDEISAVQQRSFDMQENKFTMLSEEGER
jgi:hypothetical protein